MKNRIIKFTTEDTKFLLERVSEYPAKPMQKGCAEPVMLQFPSRDLVWGGGGGRGRERGKWRGAGRRKDNPEERGEE